MSRSNPTSHSPNPATRWFEWDGEKGNVRYYDKDKKENIPLPPKFTFILLDELATVRGWHEPSQSGIYANEVRDTRSEPLVVQAFKAGILAEGFYAHIKDRVKARGGRFVANLYIAYKNDQGLLELGSLQFKGGGLSNWMDFRKEHRETIYKKAVQITGTKHGKKGKIEFENPIFGLIEISSEADLQAMQLDTQLQDYLKNYFSRRKIDQLQTQQTESADEPFSPDDDQEREPAKFRHGKAADDDDSEIPF